MRFLLPESELRQGFDDVDGAVGRFKAPDWVNRAIGKGQVFRRDYSGIRVPVLVLMNGVETNEDRLPGSGYQPANADERAIIERFVARSRLVFGRWTTKLLRHVPDAKVVRYPLAGHYVFITREADVLREIHAFVGSATLARSFASSGADGHGRCIRAAGSPRLGWDRTTGAVGRLLPLGPRQR